MNPLVLVIAAFDPTLGGALSVMGGVPLLVVAKNLGQSDTRMVEKHYGHLAPSYVADPIRAGAPRFGIVKSTNVTVMR